MNTKPDWKSLDRIEARLASDKARLAGLAAKNNAFKVDLDRIARESSQKSKREPVWLEIIGGIVVMASIGIIVIGMLLL